ncbi:MAG: phosphatidylglycerophosphatase A [Acetobacteraceae bacterium]|nr:phosphatidylglycerophosphatase A [Acetobacteraceae bacterium]
MTRAIASLFGAGFLRPAPGTWGSLAALVPGAAVLAWVGPIAVLAGAGLIAAAGWWAVAVELARDGEEDPEWIVIDEAAGQWLALAGLPGFGWVGVALAFALFRLFDIAKPGPVGWADRRRGATGVMLDDLAAGALAALALLLSRLLAPPGLLP